MPTLNRFDRAGYLKVENAYCLIGEGVTDWTVAANPKTSSKQYVHQRNSSGGLTGYAPVATITAEGFNGDPVIDLIMTLGRTLDVGAKAHTTFCIVDAWTGTATAREAVEFDVVISIDNPGSGAAGEALSVTAQLTYMGDGRVGKFDEATKKFTKNI